MVNDLRGALQNGGLELYYQPKQNIRSGKLTGFEALLRWQHPQRGAVTPDEIIPIAEQTGLIKPLTHWVLEYRPRAMRGLAACRPGVDGGG